MSDVTLLKDISAKITKGTTPSTVGNEFKNQGITFFKAQSIDDEGRVVNGNLAYIDDETDEKLKRSRIVQDDLLITIAGTIGRVHRVNDKYTPANCNQAVAIVRLNQPADSKYVYYALRSPKVQGGFLGRVVHAVQANLSLTEIGLTEIYFPEIERREAIAEVLSSIDDKIDLLNRQNETLEAMAQTLFRQWFIEEADDSWEVVPITRIANFLNGLACQKFPPQNVHESLPVLKIRDLKEGISGSSDVASSSVDSKYIVISGDVIFSWSASLVVKLWDGPKCVLNQHLFKVTSDLYPKWYYYFWCKHHLARFIAVANAHATTMGHIKRSDLDSALVVVPDHQELDRMTTILNPVLEKLELNSTQISSLRKQRDTLLPKLMSGEVHVKLD